MLQAMVRFFQALALLGIAVTVFAQGTAPCAITTHAEKIGSGTIAYSVVGTGPDVLLIHGLFATKEQWDALACLLADSGYRAIAVDLPGYGKSEGYALPDYRLESEVDKLHALMARLKVERLDLAGNSMGGTIASLYAKRYPRQVRSLAFIGSPLGIISWSPALHDAIFRGINPFIPVDLAQLDQELRLLFVTPPAIPEQDKKDIVANYVRDNRHYVQVWNIVNLYNDVLAQTPPARASTLIVWGDSDQIYDVAGAEKLHRRIPGSELHVLPHAGHLLQAENAADVAPIYVAFLKQQQMAANTASTVAATTIQARFACNAGKSVNAEFINGAQSSVKLTLSDGRALSLPQATSGSGARYANANESIVFWNKGDTAFIEENGKTTYSDCTTKR